MKEGSCGYMTTSSRRGTVTKYSSLSRSVVGYLVSQHVPLLPAADEDGEMDDLRCEGGVRRVRGWWGPERLSGRSNLRTLTAAPIALYGMF